MPRLLLPVLVFAVLLLVPSSASAATCSDHPNQAAAQAAADTRDADGDGIYCESLPCPCSPAAGGSTPPPTPPATPTPTPTPSPTPTPAPSPTPAPAPVPPKALVLAGETITAQVISVVDGDTLKVRTSTGKRITVGLIGIDTPETKTSAECGGRDATASMKKLALTSKGKGRQVTLLTDPTQPRTDRARQFLAYVRATDSGKDLAAAQIAGGWSSAYVFDKPFERLAAYRAKEQAAKSAGRGAWSACGGDFHRAR